MTIGIHRAAFAAVCATFGLWAAPGAGSPAPARAADTPTLPSAFARLIEQRRLLDDPLGYRAALEKRGLAINLFYNHFYAAVMSGGVPSPEAQPQSGSVDLFAAVDLERALGWRAAATLLQVKALFHKNENPTVRALSDPIDDADGNSWFYIAQLWYEQGLWQQRVRLRLGYLDEQVIIDRNAYANSEDKQFSATFLDNNPTVPLTIGLGAAVQAKPLDWMTLTLSLANAETRLRSAGFDSAFDDWRGYTVYLEADSEVAIPGPRGPLPGTYRIGGLRDPRQRREYGTGLDPSDPLETKREDFGVYCNFDQMVFRERAGDDQGLGLFGRYGHREPDVNPITNFVSAGWQYRGAIPGRDTDVLGLAMYGAYLSNQYDQEQPEDLDREIGVELYYSLQVTPWFALTPDFQWIESPGGRSSAANVWLFVLRGRATL